MRGGFIKKHGYFRKIRRVKKKKQKTEFITLEEFEKATIAKKQTKDSVFLDLFGQKEYLLQLYQVLHPEDKTTTEDDLMYITLNRVLLQGLYNDLGFLAGDKLLVLVEAQSTWTVNIIPRILIYLAHSLQTYLNVTNANIYGKTPVKIPKIELYVLFTCNEAKGVRTLSFIKEFFGGEKRGSDIEVKVHVLYRDNKKLRKNCDIIAQYTAFTKIFDISVARYGRNAEAVSKAIELCQGRNILTEYFKQRKEEVRRIMLTLFEQERVDEIERYNLIKETTEKVARETTERVARETTEKVARETTEKVARETTEKVARENAKKMVKAGRISLAEVPEFFSELSEEALEEIREEVTCSHHL